MAYDSSTRPGFRRGPQRILGGICGGIAQQTGLNVWLVRLLMLLLFALPFFGWILYAVVWVVTPDQRGSVPIARVFGR